MGRSVLNIMLDAERASELARLAQRVQVNEGTLARSLLASAIDDADPAPTNVVRLLDGIDGAYDRAMRGRRQAADGNTIPLDELQGWHGSGWRRQPSRTSTAWLPC